MAREREGHGAKVPGSELARVLLADLLQGANWPWSEKALNLLSYFISVPFFFFVDCRVRVRVSSRVRDSVTFIFSCTFLVPM